MKNCYILCQKAAFLVACLEFVNVLVPFLAFRKGKACVCSFHYRVALRRDFSSLLTFLLVNLKTAHSVLWSIKMTHPTVIFINRLPWLARLDQQVTQEWKYWVQFSQKSLILVEANQNKNNWLLSNFLDKLKFPALFSVRNRWEEREKKLLTTRQLFLFWFACII